MGVSIRLDPVSGDDLVIETVAEGSQRIADTLANHGKDGSHIKDGSDEIDGDKLSISFVPSAYSRTPSSPFSTLPEELASHLAGIDAFLTSSGIVGSGTPDRVVKFLTATSVTDSSIEDDGTDVTVDARLMVDDLAKTHGLELIAQASNPGDITANTLWVNNVDDDFLYHGNRPLASQSTSYPGVWSDLSADIIIVDGQFHTFEMDKDNELSSVAIVPHGFLNKFFDVAFPLIVTAVGTGDNDVHLRMTVDYYDSGIVLGYPVETEVLDSFIPVTDVLYTWHDVVFNLDPDLATPGRTVVLRLERVDDVLDDYDGVVAVPFGFEMRYRRL
jgi:hypothetical protein